jgi:hypothetical protein
MSPSVYPENKHVFLIIITCMASATSLLGLPNWAKEEENELGVE